MRFGLLGTVMVERGGALVEVGSAKPRAVLAALLLDANAAVPVEALIDALWGERPPASVTASVHNHVMRLRRLLGDEGGRIRAAAPGYLIRVEPGELDLDEFARLCRGGRLAAEEWRWAAAARDLGSALALWRGDPVADVPRLGGHPRLRTLAEARLQALEGRIEADLALGRHRDLVGELRTLATEHPLRERFHGQLMLALYRSDRRAEALEVFSGLRGESADGRGAQPSAEIRELHGKILNADPGLAGPAGIEVDGIEAGGIGPAGADRDGAGPAAPEPDGRRAQLPADTRVFTGREAELDQLMALIRQAPEGTEAGMVVISAIDGMGGIGKTALAVHAGHRVRDRFPDGQLFLDLRGYASGLEPLSAGDALERLLRSRGVPPQLIPHGLGERAAFYRDRLAGSRTLIILDNAASAAQVRPLLPAGPGCLVLITSRRRLTGLDDARSLPLDVLPARDAVALLHKVAGPGRIPAHNPAVGELADLCGRMPLAIRIAAARLRHQSDLRIEDMIARLRDDTVRLDHLQDEDRGLAAVFELSYRDLAADEQHMFRGLGLIPGPDFDAHAAAAAADVGLPAAERLLETLLDHNLLTQHTLDRYRFHELIRLYARSLSDTDLAGDQEASVSRLLDYYLVTAHAADRRLTRVPRAASDVTVSTAVPGEIPSTTSRLANRPSAMAWMRAERDNLTAAVELAAAHGRTGCQIELIAAMASFLQQEGPWPQAAALHQAAATAAHGLGDRLAKATALHDLARIRLACGEYAAALSLNERAAELYREAGDRLGEANAVWAAGRVRLQTGEDSAADLLGRSLAMYRDLGDRLGEANALNELGRIQLLKGDLSVAVDLMEQALAVYQELGDHLGQANALWELGRVRIATGDLGLAAELLEACRAISVEVDHRIGEASALHELGRLHVLTGPFPLAGELLEQAMAILRDFGYRLNEASTIWELGRLRLVTGDFPAAVDLMEQALVIFKDLGNRHGMASVRTDLGRALQAIGDVTSASDMFEQALAGARELGLGQSEVEILNNRAFLVAETTGPGEALALFRENLSFARELDNPMEEARALDGMAHCLEQMGDVAAALAGQRDAAELYQRIGAVELTAAQTYLAVLESAAAQGGQSADESNPPPDKH